MQLQYLDFDFSDEDTGRGSFDAMASVSPDRLPALLAEIASVLRWSVDTFGSCAARDVRDDVAEWDHALQAVAEPDLPLDIVYDEGRGEVVVGSGGAAYITVTFTLSGSPAFCDAFGAAFELGD